MRHAWAIGNCTEEVLRTSAQYGVKDLIVYSGPGSTTVPGTTRPLGKPRAEYQDYLALRRRIESYGLRIEGVEGGFSLYPEYRDIMFGGPRRDELIEGVIGELRDMARAGIRIWGYQWMPVSVWRGAHARLRGGARGTAYDHSEYEDAPHYYGKRVDEEHMWKCLEYWLKAVTPVAEEEGIRIGIHPDDPPVPERGGVPGLFRSFAAYKRYLDICPSDHNAIEFCQGTFSEMAGEDIYEMVKYFTERRKVLFVHFRNVSGRVPKFTEEFINTGYVDMYRVMNVYRDAGYDGVFMDDHCPLLTDDAEFPGNVGGYRSRLFAQGYIQGLVESVAKQKAGKPGQARTARRGAQRDQAQPGTSSASLRPGMGQGGGPTPEFLRMAAQLGAHEVIVNTPSLPARNGRWELPDLVNLRIGVENYGLKLAAIENTPINFRDHIVTGGPERDRQIENMIFTIRNIARAGIPYYTYSWKYPRIYRTAPVEIRGGAVATAFDADLAKAWPEVVETPIDEAAAWRHLEYWIKAITPVAEEEGIRLGVHPNDPPVPVVCGVAQPIRSFAAYKRLLDIYPSEANAILLCQGSCSQMAGEDIYEMIRYFAERKKILYVHFRNVSGQVPKFHEEFVNTGYVDMYRAMRTYFEAGYDGFFIDDHVPHTYNDTEYGHRARAFANGYIQSLIDAVTKGGANA